jgi:hypothetical protein
MEINWNEIKKEILAEIKDIMSSDRDIKINEVLDLFVEVLKFPLDDSELSGIESRIPNAIQKILIEPLSRVDKNTFFTDVAKIEPYLRKILFITNKQLYDQIKLEKKGLGAIISVLGLNPNRVDYSSTSLTTSQSTHFSTHLIKAYNLRNLEGHNCTEWTNTKLYDELRSVLIIFLYATYRHYNELKIAINPFDVTSYLKNEIKKIKILQSRFVHIEGKEEINEIALYAKEMMEDIEENEEEENEITEDKIAREGTIDSLRNSINEKKMIILGDVGMGKSTTLLYLHLKDSEAALNDKNKSIPIYLELKYLTDKDVLVNKIKAKLELDDDLAEDLLKRGKLNISLDGLNEIENKIKANVFKQISSLINDYPNNFYLITSRPQHYNREFDNQIGDFKIPVFLLQKMKDNQIEDFLTRNGKSVKSYILNEINNNDRLKKIIQTPLMLTMLIAVVIKEGKIPSEKGKIIRAFMFSLYDREQRQIIDFDKDLFHLLLCFLGFQTRDLTGSNSGIERDEYILPLLEQRKEQLGIPVNLIDFLRKAIDLNILVNENNQYSFSHELYQEYYAAEYLHQLMKS